MFLLRCSIDLDQLDFDKTYYKLLKLNGSAEGVVSCEEREEVDAEVGTVHLLLSKTGLSVVDAANAVDMKAMRRRYVSV